jgi:hypothetical protein
MKMASHDYGYEPLPSNGKHIRLLTIFPSRDNESIIRTSLTVHSVPSSDVARREKLRAHLLLPSYYAISYRWIRGNPQSILVSGKPFKVDKMFTTRCVSCARTQVRHFVSGSTVSASIRKTSKRSLNRYLSCHTYMVSRFRH